MKFQKVTISSVVVLMVLLVMPVSAQEGVEVAENIVVELTVEETPSLEVVEDEAVTNEDLGVSENHSVGIFDRVGRFFKKAVTFDDVRDSELDLQYMKEDLAVLRQEWDEGVDDEKKVARIEKEMGRVNKRIGKIVKRVGDLQKGHENGDERVDAFLDDVLDTQIKQQKILTRIEDEVLDQDHDPRFAQRLFERTQQARDEAVGAVGDVLANSGGDGERLVQRIDRVLENQRGSAFKDFRNLEVLQQIGERVPEQARAAIQRAGDNALRRFNNGFEGLGSEERKDHANKFESYVKHVRGDETRHIEIFDRIKQLGDVPEELRQKVEIAKDISARRIENDWARFEDGDFEDEFRQRARKRVFARFNDGEADVAKMRVMEEIKQRVRFENEELQKEIDEQHTEGVKKFRQAFTGDVGAQDIADRFERLSKQMADNPDPTTFRLLEELEKELTPEQREFVDKMDREVKTRFAERARDEGDDFFRHIESNNPEDIEVFQRLREEFGEHPDRFGDDNGRAFGAFQGDEFGDPSGPRFDQFFDRAIDHQTEFITDQIHELDNPEEFERFKRKFRDADEGLFAEFDSRGGEFRNTFDTKQQRIRQIELDEQEREVGQNIREEQFRIEEGFRSRIDAAGSDEERERLIGEEQQQRDDLFRREIEQRKEFFGKRLESDPFCDAACQDHERRAFEQSFDQRFENRPDKRLRPTPEFFEGRDEGERFDIAPRDGDGQRFDNEERPSQAPRFEGIGNDNFERINNEPQRPRFDTRPSDQDARPDIHLDDRREELFQQNEFDRRDISELHDDQFLDRAERPDESDVRRNERQNNDFGRREFEQDQASSRFDNQRGVPQVEIHDRREPEQFDNKQPADQQPRPPEGFQQEFQQAPRFDQSPRDVQFDGGGGDRLPEFRDNGSGGSFDGQR